MRGPAPLAELLQVQLQELRLAQRYPLLTIAADIRRRLAARHVHARRGIQSIPTRFDQLQAGDVVGVGLMGKENVLPFCRAAGVDGKMLMEQVTLRGDG